MTDTPAAALGRAGPTDSLRALDAVLVLARQPRLPTRTNQPLVLSLATPETRWRSLATTGTPAAATGRAGPTDSLPALDAVLVLARLVKCPTRTRLVMVISRATPEPRWKLLAMLGTPAVAPGRAGTTETLRALHAVP